MVGFRRSIVIDARVNGFPGAHGLARSVMKLIAHMSEPTDRLVLRVLINPRETQIFPLSELPTHADLVETDVRVRDVHRGWELARLMRAVGAAVLYVPHPTLAPFSPLPCPFVLTVHDCTIESDVAFAGNWLRQAATRAITGIALRRATAMTAPSRAALADIRRHYPAAPNPTLIPNGVDLKQFGRAPAGGALEVRVQYQLPEKFILAVGARRPHKNHEILVKALANVPEHIGLVVVGCSDPNFYDRLPGLIADLSMEFRVRLVADVADKWLPALYRAASVFAFPSLAEGYGLPVLEAMAAGAPVVMSNIPVLSEVAGSAAMMVPPREVAGWASAITAVLSDASLSARLTEAGRAAAAAAGWEQPAAAMIRLLSAVAKGTRLPKQRFSGGPTDQVRAIHHKDTKHTKTHKGLCRSSCS